MADMSKSERKLPTRPVVIFAYDQAQLLDIAGPAQAFAFANEESGAAHYRIKVGALVPGLAVTSSGLPLLAQALPRSGPIDTLIVAGGPGVHRFRSDPAALAALARLCRRARRICAVCTGAFALAEIGLLSGKRAVTHWRACAQLAQEFPDIAVDPEPLFIREGSVWTTAGVTAGIDLALALIEEDIGTPIAAKVARRLVVYMRRPGGQRQYSDPLELQSAAADRYETLMQKVIGKPTAAWTVETMAAEAGQSVRSFHRNFLASAGTTPGEAVERVRCELARSLLQTTDLKLARIAGKTGFGSESALRRALKRQFGVPASDLRARF